MIEHLQPCIQKFIAEQMDCKTPWEGHFSNKSRDCSSIEELKNYFDLRLDIYRGHYNKELNDLGCLIPNCFQNHWTHKDQGKISRNAFIYEYGKDESNIQIYHFTASSKKVTKGMCTIFLVH